MNRLRRLGPIALAVAALAAAWAVLLIGLIVQNPVLSTAGAAAALASTVGCALLWRNHWLRLRADLVRVRRVAGQSTEQVTVLSHEIRTPLALIKGASDLLIEQTPGPLNEQQLRFMRTVSTNSANLVELAEDLLTQARIDAGMFDVHLQRTDLRALARTTVRELRALHSVAISLDSPGAPPRLWVDTKLVKQAITNLVNNAVKASPEASTITVRVIDLAGEGATIAVSDNGSGMSDLERKHLFERFASGRPLRDGTGMGLVITRQIARLHGGDLYVDTVSGRGTTIIMTIPLTNEVADAGLDGEDSSSPSR
jgi:two-component system OmpR family sensor kinase